MNVLVVGGGVAGRAVARALSARGDRVCVLSRTPRSASGLWLRGDVVTGQGLKTALRDVDAAIFAAWDPSPKARVLDAGPEQLARALARRGISRLMILGPAGPHPLLGAWRRGLQQARSHVPGALALQLPTLFGEDDHLLSPWLERARAGRSFAVRGAALEPRLLWTEDAALAALAALDGPGAAPGVDLSIQGPAPVRLGALADAVARRFGVSWRRALRGAPGWLAAPPQAPDGWEALGLGARLKAAALLAEIARDGPTDAPNR